MSEVDTRPPPNRGRSAYRGGRGGFGRGGPRGGRKPTNGADADASQVEESLEEQGELGEMKKKYASELVMLKDMFPDWTDVDLVFALQEADGDVPATVDHITQGNVSQFAEVKSAKDRARSKVKDPSVAAGGTDKASTRGGRGRGGFESTRGGRGRGSERGRGAFRGGRGGHTSTNGSSSAGAASVPTTEAAGWDDGTTTATAEGSWDTPAPDANKTTGDSGQSAWGDVVTSETTPAAASEGVKSSLIPEGGAKKSWASMFASKPAPAPAKQASAPQPPPAELVASDQVPPETAPKLEEIQLPESTPPSLITEEPPQTEPPAMADLSTPEQPLSATAGEELTLTPSQNPLTEENVEHLPDESHPPATATAASTTGSIDPRNMTPLPGQQAPIARPPLGGYATSAYRATGVPGRSASYQRRVQEQQEAVVMPGHNAVDRAAVQFGSMGLNGEPGPDVDEDREDPETRQAPQHSPPSQPRTSLPPAPRHVTAAQETVMPESLPTPKQAPGLPPASQQNQQQMQEAALPPGIPSEQSQMGVNYGQYSRYGQPGMQQESSMQQQKPYDSFSHQAQASQYDQYGTQTQQAPQQQQQSHSSFGGLSSAPNDFSSYYTADQQPRAPYSSYYGGNSYGPQDVRSQIGAAQQQDAGLGQQRSASGFGAGPNESAFSSQAQQQVSVPPSLLELNAALESCSNEEERQFLLKEIQRVISNASSQTNPLARTIYGPRPSVLESIGPETAQDSQFQSQLSASAAPLSDAQARFTDPTGSGHNTPNPLMGGPQQSAQSTQQPQQHSAHQAAGHQQQSGYGAGQGAGYQYGHQYYPSPYQQYQGQYGGYNNQLGGYGGGGYPSKHGGMYGGSHGYGMGPQSSYDQHSASPANAGAFGHNQQTSMRSASGMSAGLSNLDDYGRSSAQPAAHQQSSGFGGMSSDTFARSASGFGGQSGYGQQSMAGQEDSLKPYNDSKGGPSPALGQPGVRPGSAANSAGGSAQSGLPPPQSHQSGFGGYPGFPSQSQYGGLGGLGSQQQQQHGQNNMGGQAAYGSYGAGGFNQTYGGYSRGGGWGSNYGAH
ncbi:RNAPII degradation factor [Vermiconidia calcicola]|uniref:RNAPII degradation factor n=1 Tax=Vermiconidia calcicola TaxID=1690605 RepID=A0ACC3MEF0_9PEZI|nr:RNAPII degradation factor [Vermiconidia calcicola]